MVGMRRGVRRGPFRFTEMGLVLGLFLVGLVLLAGDTLRAQGPAKAARPEVGTPPTVTITSPQPLQKVTGVYKIQASTIDDGGIAQTVFLVDGQPIQAQFQVVPLKMITDKALLLDTPDLKTSKPRKGLALTGFLYNYYAYWYSYRWPDGAHLLSATVIDKANLTAQDSLYALSENQPHVDPKITVISTLKSPFRLLVMGNYFLPGARVLINRSIAPTVQVKSSIKIVVKGGRTLKSLLPRGVPVPIVVINPEGAGSDRYNFILP